MAAGAFGAGLVGDGEHANALAAGHLRICGSDATLGWVVGQFGDDDGGVAGGLQVGECGYGERVRVVGVGGASEVQATSIEGPADPDARPGGDVRRGQNT